MRLWDGKSTRRNDFLDHVLGRTAKMVSGETSLLHSVKQQPAEAEPAVDGGHAPGALAAAMA
jgi:hypothetical protein